MTVLERALNTDVGNASTPLLLESNVNNAWLTSSVVTLMKEKEDSNSSVLHVFTLGVNLG